MGFSKSGSVFCNFHPNQRQSPGICAACLSERLILVLHSRSMEESSDSSPSSSSSSPPCHRIGGHGRNQSDRAIFFSAPLVFQRNELKKSRSVAVAPRGRDDGEKSFRNNKNRKARFWKKLISSTKEVFLHPIGVRRKI